MYVYIWYNIVLAITISASDERPNALHLFFGGESLADRVLLGSLDSAVLWIACIYNRIASCAYMS